MQISHTEWKTVTHSVTLSVQLGIVSYYMWSAKYTQLNFTANMKIKSVAVMLGLYK